jgi:PAS domain S-box-containing protein
MPPMLASSHEAVRAAVASGGSVEGTSAGPSLGAAADGLVELSADELVERARRFLGLTRELVCVIEDGRWVEINSVWEQRLGWSRDELLALSPIELVHEDDRAALQAICEDGLRGGVGPEVEIRCRCKDGSFRWVLWSMSWDGGQLYAVGTDVTALRRAERDAARSGASLGALREGICVLDGRGRVTEVSDRLCAMTGFLREELVGATAPYPFWPDERVDALAQALSVSIAQGQGTAEVVLCRKSGERFPALIDVQLLTDSSGEPGILGVFRDVSDQVCERERLAASEAALREAQDVAGIGTWDWDCVSDRFAFSAGLAELTGLSLEAETTLADVAVFVAPEHRDALLSGLRSLLGDAQEYVGRHRFDVPNRALTWLEARARAFRDAAGNVVRVRGTVQDVSEQMHAGEAARVRARLLDEVDAAVLATDLAGTVTYWNDGAQQLYGWTPSETIGRPLTALTTGASNASLATEIMASIRESGHWEGEFEVRRKDGTEFPAYMRAATIEDDDGTPVGLVGVLVDITERVRGERELRSARDYLTAVTDSIGEGLCTVDTDGRIAYVNEAAERLLGWTKAELRGRRLHEMTHFRRVDGSTYPAAECPLFKARVGGEAIRVEDDVFIRKDGSALPVAYTSAPIEMADGLQGSVIVFTDITERKREQDRMQRDVEALAWLARIREALEDDRFLLHAQPIIDLASGETVQHELLIRMLDEQGGLVPPGLFLPVAEQYGLIREIDRWVIRQGAQLAAHGNPIELNISAESLGDPGLYDVVERELQAAGADPRLVVIEITETALLKNEDVAQTFIERVAALGCRVALDDFGTGYGGFTYVKRLPVDYLKIDIEFVRDLPRSPASQHVVRAIVGLARDFGQQTVAEGVEDQQTLQMLRDYGVDYAQGYAIGRPAPIEQAALTGTAHT